ncbi:MAG: proline dehydrogenase family protein, partial [Gemmatimonadota bacterium]|nr:proline dehydrogenase family protein [Gemmatimonadota bacterium]
LSPMSIARSILLWGSQNAWLEGQAKRRSFAQRAVRRFMPGEQLDDAFTAAATLAGRGMGTVLTQLGEALGAAAEADAVRDHYLAVLEQIETRALPAVISVKPTQLGIDFDVGACHARIETLAARAAARGDRVWIDMEDSSYVDVTLDLFRQLRSRHDNVGVCIQSYLRRSATDLEGLLPLKPAIRLVKGAYAEPATVAFPDKRDTDASYTALATTLIEQAARHGGVPPVLGTHDVKIIRSLQHTAAAAGLDRKACAIHMLYGIRTAEQDRFHREGHAVRVLISYGSAWFRWYMRRLAERPANLWFVARSAFG